MRIPLKRRSRFERPNKTVSFPFHYKQILSKYNQLGLGKGYRSMIFFEKAARICLASRFLGKPEEKWQDPFAINAVIEAYTQVRDDTRELQAPPG
jgi:hypothetical protein